jgi:diacylglycerol O-acyltransferase-1
VLALVQQWIIPSVVNSLIPFSNMDFFKALERILKLALPNHLIWLIWFYLIFHSLLNATGEILRFADREFYHDWWNANNILVFWKSWNIPVHRFCVRHVFKPMLRSGYSVTTAQIVVFAFSAFFHEYLVSVPLRVFKIYAFLGMVAQIPLIVVSKYLETAIGPRAGNICVWLSLIIGQPLALMMYYHDFVVEHYGKELISYYGDLNKF